MLQGCYQRIAAWVESSTLVMLIVAAIIVVIEVSRHN